MTTQTKQQPATLPESGYIRVQQLIKIIPFSASTIWRKAKKGTFPKPYKLSEQVTAWKNSEILEWQKSIENKGINHD